MWTPVTDYSRCLICFEHCRALALEGQAPKVQCHVHSKWGDMSSREQGNHVDQLSVPLLHSFAKLGVTHHDQLEQRHELLKVVLADKAGTCVVL